MKFFKYLIFLILILIIGFSIYIAVQPNRFEIEKSKTMNAPARVIFETLKNSTKYGEWSEWHATNISESVFSENPLSIQQKVASNELPNSDINWELKPNGNGTTDVNWILRAENVSFGSKVKAYLKGGFVNVMGLSNDKSLDKLNDVVVKSMEVYSIEINGVTEYGGGFYLYKTTSSNSNNVSNEMAKQFTDILNYMNSNSIPTSGMPFTMYIHLDLDSGDATMSNAIPVNNQVIMTENSTILCGFMGRTKAIKATLKGNHSNLKQAWKLTVQYFKDNQLIASDIDPFEIYVNDPGSFPNPADWITEIYIPIKTQETEPTL